MNWKWHLVLFALVTFLAWLLSGYLRAQLERAYLRRLPHLEALEAPAGALPEIVVEKRLKEYLQKFSEDLQEAPG